MKPTYFLPPDFISYAFESEADSGPIRLGQLISDINDPGQPVGSLEPLDPKSYDIEPRSIPGDNFSHIYEAQTSLSASLFLKAVQVIGLNFSIQVDKSDYSQLLSEIAGFEARSFEVKESYVRASMEQPSVQMWIKKGLFGKRVFMVTGILIAKPKDGRKSTISVSRENRSEQSGDLEASNAAAGQPGPAAVSGGAAAKRASHWRTAFHLYRKLPSFMASAYVNAFIGVERSRQKRSRKALSCMPNRLAQKSHQHPAMLDTLYFRALLMKI
jgi:hypothetical protein